MIVACPTINIVFDSFFSLDIVRAAYKTIEESGIFLGLDSPTNEELSGWENFYTVTELILDNFDHERDEGEIVLWNFYKWYYPKYFGQNNIKKEAN